MGEPSLMESQIKRVKLETPLRDHMRLNQSEEWERKTVAPKNILKELQNLPKPKTDAYFVSDQ